MATGDLLFCCGFECLQSSISGDGYELNGFPTGGTVSTVATNARTGGGNLRINRTSANYCGAKPLAPIASGKRQYSGVFSLYVASLPSANNIGIFDTGPPSGYPIIYLDSSGHLTATLDGGTPTSTIATLSAGNRYRIEYQVDTSTTTYSFSVRVDGGTPQTATLSGQTAADLAGTWGDLGLGSSASHLTAGNFDLYYDDWIVLDGATWPGDYQARAIYPDGDVTTTNWTKSGSSPAATYADGMDEATPNDGTDYNASTSNTILRVSLGTYTLQTGESCNGAMLWGRIGSNGTQARNATVALLDGSNTVLTSGTWDCAINGWKNPSACITYVATPNQAAIDALRLGFTPSSSSRPVWMTAAWAYLAISVPTSADATITAVVATATGTAVAPTPTLALSPPASAATAAAVAPSLSISPTVVATVASATGAALAPSIAVDITVAAVVATATVSAVAPIPRITLLPGTANATAAASAPSLVISPTVAATVATATGSAPAPVPALTLAPSAAAATGGALAPVQEIRLLPAAAGATGASLAPSLRTDSTVVATIAGASGSALAPLPALALLPPVAGATGSGLAPTPALTLLPSSANATGSSLAPTPGISITSVIAAATASALAPIPAITITAAISAASAAALAPQIGGNVDIAAIIAAATAGALAPTILITLAAPTADASATALAPTPAITIPAAISAATAAVLIPSVSAGSVVSVTLQAAVAIATFQALVPEKHITTGGSLGVEDPTRGAAVGAAGAPSDAKRGTATVGSAGSA